MKMAKSLLECDICKGYFESKDMFSIKPKATFFQSLIDMKPETKMICKECKTTFRG